MGPHICQPGSTTTSGDAGEGGTASSGAGEGGTDGGKDTEAGISDAGSLDAPSGD
jgi:hypothetical protein